MRELTVYENKNHWSRDTSANTVKFPPHARKTSGTQGTKPVVALYRVNDILELQLMWWVKDLVSPVEWNVYEVCPSVETESTGN